MWKLISEKDGSEIKIGNEATTFRGEKTVIKELLPPRHSSSSGHYVNEHNHSYYVSVIHAKFVWIKE